MATLALAAAGAAVGGAILPGGISVFGATLSGAMIGAQVGALAGSYVDQALFGATGRKRSVGGPRLNDLSVTSSVEGAAVPRIYGQVRLGGQIIWARDIEEIVIKSEAGGRAKGGGSAPRSAAQTEYQYFATFAVALCEGRISGLGRVWADGREFDLAQATYRLHLGTEDQDPDSLIAAVEGSEGAPAYRGIAYIVFEGLALAEFGNRIPQLSFEVARAADDLDSLIRGVVLIPGSGEFVYATQPVTRLGPAGRRIADNVHTRVAATDWTAALDQLEAQLPAARSVSLVVSWFGDDLRAGHCTVTPRVDRREKQTAPLVWSVAGLDRQTARVVSNEEGRPAYGGTPSDETVVAAIVDLKRRGMAVTYNPFVLMDVAPGNTLPDPLTGATGQPPYPWRGRIAVDAASILTGDAASQIASFLGTCRADDFVLSGGRVAYRGADEWSYRRFVLHQAFLAKLAGGVDAFLIGSELRGLTTSRDAVGSYPFVQGLLQLARDVKTILGPETKVTYAADWSEYFGHQPTDGSGDVAFHLDPLWASPDIDAVGIDLYWPLADWRQGDHEDRRAGARSIYDLDYLKGNLKGGEGYDWYYRSADDRRLQIRTPITDGTGKPWVFRYKDLESWWRNRHFDRPGGVEAALPTAWQPESKPIWLLEVGCPAVDMGANQPNVFVDPKSSESFLPYFSSGRRDDLMQRRYLRALIEAYTLGHPGALQGLNPTSSVYGGPMVPPERIHVYAWDARPYPAFPANDAVWSDGENWRLGHWITGRMTRGSLAETVSRILAEMGFNSHATGELVGIVPGYVLDRIMSAREALEPLELAYFFDSVESGGTLRFHPRGGDVVAIDANTDDLVEARSGDPLFTLTRAQEADLPASAKITYLSADADYRQAVAEARRVAGASGRIAEAQLPIVLEAEQAASIAESWLFESWAARERASFTLPPSALAAEVGDIVELGTSAGRRLFRITETGDHGARSVEARSFDAAVYAPVEGVRRKMRRPSPISIGQPIVEFLDLPTLGSEPIGSYVAATANPWPGGLAVYKSVETSGFNLAGRIMAPATMGRTVSALAAGAGSRLDPHAKLIVELESGFLASVSPIAMLGGANTAAVRTDHGWEILQFERAELIGEQTYELSRLLRGQAGTEDMMADPLPPSVRFVLIDPTLTRLELSIGDVGAPYRWRVGPVNRDVGHPDYAEVATGFAGRSLKPLAPVHLRGRRDQDGALHVWWKRRTRLHGDSWEIAEVPLGEADERYRIEILNGETIVRELMTTEPAAIYTAADQANDFGHALPARISLRVAQLSAVAGAGAAAQATL